jgi:hypothetical protein
MQPMRRLVGCVLGDQQSCGRQEGSASNDPGGDGRMNAIGWSLALAMEDGPLAKALRESAKLATLSRNADPMANAGPTWECVHGSDQGARSRIRPAPVSGPGCPGGISDRIRHGACGPNTDGALTFHSTDHEHPFIVLCSVML